MTPHKKRKTKGTVTVAFELTMPCRASWNGQWSGQDRRYIRFLRLRASTVEQLESSYWYAFGDGWSANIDVSVVEAAESRRLRKIARGTGFCGYEWMVDSILAHGTILNRTQQREAAREAALTAPSAEVKP